MYNENKTLFRKNFEKFSSKYSRTLDGHDSKINLSKTKNLRLHSKMARTHLTSPNVKFTPASTPGRKRSQKKPSLNKINVPLRSPPAEPGFVFRFGRKSQEIFEVLDYAYQGY